jgi:hypothetical protein
VIPMNCIIACKHFQRHDNKCQIISTEHMLLWYLQTLLKIRSLFTNKIWISSFTINKINFKFISVYLKMVVWYRTRGKLLKIRIQINKTKSVKMNLNRFNNPRLMGEGDSLAANDKVIPHWSLYWDCNWHSQFDVIQLSKSQLNVKCKLDFNWHLNRTNKN